MEGERARRVVRRTTHRVVGRFPSWKSGRTIHWESQLERDLLYQLEVNPDVRSFREQPETIALKVSGVSRRYTPDLAVQLAHGIHVIEVKPQRVAAQPEWRDLTVAAGEHYRAQGVKYEVLTEVEIRIQPRLDNAKLIFRFLRHPVADALRFRIRTALEERPLPICELLGAVPSVTLPDVLALAGHGHLFIDMDVPVTAGSLVQHRTEE